MAERIPIIYTIDPSKVVAGGRVVERQLTSIGNKSRVVATHIAGMFAAFAGAAGAADFVRVNATFEESIARVGALTSASEDQMRQFESVARQLGATTQFSAAQAADGMAFLAQAGFEAQEALAGAEKTLLLAEVGMTGMASAADIASNVLSGFGLEVDQLGRVVDVLALAASSSNTNVLQLGQAMKVAAPLARSLGVSLEEVTALIGTLGDVGIQGSLAGTGIQTVLAGLLDAGYDLSQGLIPVLQQLQGISQADALDLVGREGIKTFLPLLDAANDRLLLMNANLENAAGAAERMAQRIRDNLNTRLKELRSAIEEVYLSLAEFVNLNGIVSSITNFVRTFGQNIDNVVQSAKALLAVFIAISATKIFTAVGIGILGSIVRAIAAISSTAVSAGIAIVSRNFVAIGAALASIPGTVVAVIAAVTGSILSIAKIGTVVISVLAAFRDTFRESDSGAFRRLGNALEAMVRVIQSLIDTHLPGFVDFESDFKSVLERMADAMSSLIEVMFDAVDSIMGFINTIPVIINRAIRGVITGLATSAAPGTGPLWDAVSRQFEGVGIGADTLRQQEENIRINERNSRLLEKLTTMLTESEAREAAARAQMAAGGLSQSQQRQFNNFISDQDDIQSFLRRAIASTGTQQELTDLFEIAFQQGVENSGLGDTFRSELKKVEAETVDMLAKRAAEAFRAAYGPGGGTMFPGGGAVPGTLEGQSSARLMRTLEATDPARFYPNRVFALPEQEERTGPTPAEVTQQLNQQLLLRTELVGLEREEAAVRQEIASIERQYIDAGLSGDALEQRVRHYEAWIRGIQRAEMEHQKLLEQAQAVQNFFISATDTLTDKFISIWSDAENTTKDHLKKMKEAVGDFVEYSITQLIKLGLQKTVGAVVSSAFGFPVPGFRDGGSILVGGSGGPDSQIVGPFRASPGERIDITPVGRQRGDMAPLIFNIEFNIEGDADADKIDRVITMRMPEILENSIHSVRNTGRNDPSLLI